jgi:hypothetical protein
VLLADRHGPPIQRRRRKLSMTGVTAFVALVTAGAGLVFDFFPSLRPDPGLNRVASVSVFAVERGVSEMDYLQRTVHDPDQLGAAIAAERKAGRLNVRGELAYVDVHVEGFKRRSVTLRWSVYDASRDKRFQLGDEGGSDLFGAKRKLQAPTERSVELLWFPPLMGHDSKYFVRVQAEDSERVILAVADSKPFRGLAPPGG